MSIKIRKAAMIKRIPPIPNRNNEYGNTKLAPRNVSCNCLCSLPNRPVTTRANTPGIKNLLLAKTMRSFFFKNGIRQIKGTISRVFSSNY